MTAATQARSVARFPDTQPAARHSPNHGRLLIQCRDQPGVVSAISTFLADAVRPFGVPYFHIPATRDNRDEAERRQLELLHGNADPVVLARYMQIVSPGFFGDAGCPLINIHHALSLPTATPFHHLVALGAWGNAVLS